MRTFLLLFLTISLGIVGCKLEKQARAELEVRTYPYEILTYPDQSVEIPDSIQNTFLKNHFLPWNIAPETLEAALGALPGKELSYLTTYLEDDQWYGENKKPHKPGQREAVVSNVDLAGYPNLLQRGITIVHSDLRRIPSKRPGFDQYSKAGEGYPFDYFQETTLWAGTPVLLVHQSIDKQWCYVISPDYKGWVSMHALALVDEAFIAQWTKGTFCHPLSDDIALTNPASHFAINTKIGMVLPFKEVSSNPDMVTVSYVAADQNQKAHPLEAEVARSALAFGNYQMNATTLRPMVAELVGRPYGWGGSLENRDCSSLIRDIFSTFRVWLPRNSKDQIEIGHKYELGGSADDKIRMIKEKGVPFLTILRKKGHNMLYVGDDPEGEPLILHAIWGLKTSYTDQGLADRLPGYPIEGIHQDESGALLGRHVIGESVITSVNLGNSSSGISMPLIDEIYAMTNIFEYEWGPVD